MDIIKLVIFVVVLAGAIYLMNKKKAEISKGQSSDEPLSTKEKFIIWILCFLNPIIAGAIFYYGWKKKLPVRAKQANQISLWAFLILIIASVGFVFLVGASKPKVPQAYIDKYNEVSSLQKDALLSYGLDKASVDELTTTQDMNRALQLLDTLSSKNTETLLKFNTLTTKTSELSNITTTISDSSMQKEAVNLNNSIKNVNVAGIKFVEIQKKLLDEILSHYTGAKNGQNVSQPTDTADLTSQLSSAKAELQDAIFQYSTARDVFMKDAGLTL